MALNPEAKPFYPKGLNPNAEPFVPAAKSAADVRAKFTGASPNQAGIAKFISDRVKELETLGLANSVASQQDLIPVLAADMKRKAVAKGEAAEGDPVEKWLAGAKGQIEGNNTTALTTSDDRFTGLEGGVNFDQFHELVHICSAKGGESPLHHFKLQVNEGAINIFSELAAATAGVVVVPRYTDETRIMKMLLAAGGNDALGGLFSATFKGDIDAFFNVLGAECAGADPWPSKKTKGFSEKNKDGRALGVEIKKWAQNWSLKSLEDRFKV